MDNLMKPSHKRNLKFEDLVDKSNLIRISKIKNLFIDYNHKIIDRYKQSIVWHDVGCLFFLYYLMQKYKNLCNIPLSNCNIVPIHNETILEWIDRLDVMMYDPDLQTDNQNLIYYDNHNFLFDKVLFQKCKSNDKLSILIVSHIFPKGSGHVGCIFIQNDNAYYYDSNGLKDCDEKEYYNIFENNLRKVLKEFDIVYIPYVWEKGIQHLQNNEESKYGLKIMGMCCSWSFLIIELKLLNPNLTIEEIENKIKKKYKYKLTRMIVTYQQKMHMELWDVANKLFKQRY